ncbi:MAG: PHP domain-containing protein [Clostridia bacterium]|nr:PHP domain-containing protein [Clostridia bacterium]
MDLRSLTEEYPYRTELHAHSNPVSSCGKLPADEVARIYLDYGCDTLVLTNHLTEHHIVKRSADELVEYYLSDYHKAKKAAEGTGLSVALGVEIRFTGTVNDYLVYGVDENDIERMIPFVLTDIQTFYREFKNDRNIILHAHPFRDRMEPTPIGYVDGVETFNMHPGHNSRIAFATRLAREHDLTVSGGSDFHEKDRHATCLLRTKTKLRDSFDIAEALKSRDVLFDVSGHIVIPYLY